MEKVLEGVVIGVSSGFILGLAFWFLDFVKIRNERRDQMEHLAKTIERFRGLIYSANELEMTLKHGSQQQRISKDEIGKAYFDDMRRQVEGILRGRASRLSFDEIWEVRGVFYTDLFPTVLLNDRGYDQVFRKLESIQWLHLPRWKA